MKAGFAFSPFHQQPPQRRRIDAERPGDVRFAFPKPLNFIADQSQSPARGSFFGWEQRSRVPNATSLVRVKGKCLGCAVKTSAAGAFMPAMGQTQIQTHHYPKAFHLR
jgi:hypothetical protein